MKRSNQKHKSVVTSKRRVDAEKLSKFLNSLRAQGVTDAEIAVNMDTSVHTIAAWRNQIRFPRKLVILGIEAKYGVSIL